MLPQLAAILLLAIGLGSCGRSPEALNAQGYRAMRFAAHEDAHYYFKFADELIAQEGAPAGEEHPEKQRTLVGKLALGLFDEPFGSMDRIRAAIRTRRDKFGPDDYAFLATQLAVEAKRPEDARVLLAFARTEFPEDKALAELEAGLPPLPPEAPLPDPADFLESAPGGD